MPSVVSSEWLTVSGKSFITKVARCNAPRNGVRARQGENASSRAQRVREDREVTSGSE